MRAGAGRLALAQSRRNEVLAGISALARGTAHRSAGGGGVMANLLDGYLTPAELCKQLDICPKTLSRWHAIGIAPPKTRIGRRDYYKIASVEAWLTAREHRAA